MFPLRNRAQPGKTLQMIPVGVIHPNPNQPRRFFDEYELSGLAESIRCNGLIQPLSVRRREDGSYELIAGERRLRASRMAGLSEVPCIIHQVDDSRSALFSLLENLQRRDLSMFEEAEGIERLIREFKITQQDAAERLGIAQSTLANKLRLLRLTREQRERIVLAQLTERHARALVRLPSEKLREEALDKIIADQMNVVDTDRMIDSMLEPQAQSAPQPRRVPVVRDVRLFVNSITKVVNSMRQWGVDAKTAKNETDEYIEYTVIIPKKAGGKRVI